MFPPDSPDLCPKHLDPLGAGVFGKFRSLIGSAFPPRYFGLAVLLGLFAFCGDVVSQVQIFNYCDGYDVAKLYAEDITVQFGNDVAEGDVGFRVGINQSTAIGYTEYRAHSDGHGNTVTASAITFGQPLSLYGQSGTYDIIEVFGGSFSFSGSASIVDAGSDICPHGWDEVHVPLTVSIGSRTGTGPSYTKPNDDKVGGDDCDRSGGSRPMAVYSAHAMLASLNIHDTPLRYAPPIGPPIDFTVTYNQRDTQQPSTFSYSNLGLKWTFNWLSYVTDDPNNPSANVSLYVAGGGTELYAGFDSNSQSYQSDAQSHATLIKTSASSYEKRFPDGSKQIFGFSDGATASPRKIFMTQWMDRAGNGVTIGYDASSRVTTITDALGQVTTIGYELANDPLKITKVIEPFPTGRYAAFAYNSSGQLASITDEIGIVSSFTYSADATNFITALQTPYGTSTFSTGESETNRWVEMTDPLGNKERVEYRDNAPGINSSDATAPAGMTNSGLDVANTFFWDKKALEAYPAVNGVYDYAKARITHWTSNPNGTPSGVRASEKTPLQNRVWYGYAGQADTNQAPLSANPTRVARTFGDGSTQISSFEYNSLGNPTKSTDPAGRVTSYVYHANNIDILEMRQTTGASNELLRKTTYNAQHKPLMDTDAAGQPTTYSYNALGQMLTRTNAKNETTTLAYGDGTPGKPVGYLTSVTSPLFNNASAVTTFAYDNANRLRTVTDSDGYAVTTDYDNLDRPTQVTYPDGTNQQFQYSQDFGQGISTILDLTRSKDRRGLWTIRHYNANRQMDSITDPLNRTTQFGWCNCGSLTTITDPKNQVTTFNRDLEGRVYQKVFADNTSINYLYDGQSAANTPGASNRIKSVTDAKVQRTNYSYLVDDNIQQITYTNTTGQPLNPATPSVTLTYDPNYNRVKTMVDGIGTTTYSYNPINAPPVAGAGQLASIDGPLANDTISFGYDQLGRVTSRTINGAVNSASWNFDSLGRISSNTNKLGTFSHNYINVTGRLAGMSYPDGGSTVYSYFPNAQDKRLQQIKNQTSTDALISQFDYTYDPEGQILSWSKNYPGLSPAPQRSDFSYDDTDQLISAPLKNATTNALIKQYSYGYDLAANRTSELVGTTTTTSTPNTVNEIVSQSGGANRMLSYDANGSLTNDGSARTFEWDGANRLVAVNNTAAGTRSEFSYDGLNRMVKILEKSKNGRITSTRKFVWCGIEKCEFRDANDAVTLFVYPQGQVSGTTPYFYTRDHLGSIREMRSAGKKGAIVARFDYDPYGRSTSMISTTLPDFNFTGLYRHAASNLDLAVFRAYDPDLGRWLSRDPIGESGGTNLYSYVTADPTNLIDARGLLTIFVHGTWSSPAGTFDRNFIGTVMDYFNENTARFFSWSGANTNDAREDAAEQLAQLINDFHDKCPDQPIIVVAHSHGGNVALLASAFAPIDVLVTLGTPILPAYSPGGQMGDWINVYSTGDRVQTLPLGAGRTSPYANSNTMLSGFGHSQLHTVQAWNAAFPRGH